MTFTRLTLGEPFLQGIPSGDAPCGEPRVYSSNLMNDLAGFESTASLFAGDGGEPGFRDNSPLSSHDGSERGWTFVGSSFASLESLGLVSIARSTANPRSGSYNLRVVWATDDNTAFLYLSGGRQCGEMLEYPVSFRANPGDLATFSIWYEVDWTTTGPSGWGIALHAVNSAGGGVELDGVEADGSSSDVGTYTQLSCSMVCPANTYWLRCIIRVTGGGTIDLDDAICSLE